MTSTTISSLPAELLAEIFAHSLPELHSSPRIHNSPLLLTRVSRLWHDVALATPVLWATFSTTFASSKNILPLEIVERWLSRSQNLPLSIYVDDSIDYESTDPDPHLWAFYEQLCRHAQRWQDVTLNIPFTLLWRLPIQQPLEMLERLKMGRDEEGQSVSDRQITAFMTAPRLRVADIVLDVDEVMTAQGLALPWAQLSVFRGRLFNWNECLYVLAQATCLAECEFNDVVGGYVPGDGVVAPSLQVLRLDASGLHKCTRLMSWVTVPNLRKFALGSKTQTTPDHITWPVFRRFLSRSSCALTHLHISANTSFSEWDQLVSRHSLFPLLEHLEIFWFHDDSNLAPLIQTSDAGAPLPRLHTVVLHSQTSPKDASLMNIISLLFARTAEDWPATRLSRFEYKWDITLDTEYLVAIDETVWARVAVLRDQGVRIFIGSMEAYRAVV
ncbi:hypothetical protein MIND_01000100 [Mycena indigotica]|uniref:F-box domain-containing protein n=1 Tax=Mycena indigotica TaxID=2126181 RepID=A0A8H6S7U7_9AGAR|nr:uncharacterized protein MIND_01000100 [Mycena indigotica]KAF7294635.1 hypothetical protein MIND_01000100 [Mycena indigotica]